MAAEFIGCGAGENPGVEVVFNCMSAPFLFCKPSTSDITRSMKYRMTPCHSS